VLGALERRRWTGDASLPSAGSATHLVEPTLVPDNQRMSGRAAGRIRPVAALTRAELRHRWRATVVLVALLGVVGGVVLGAAIGARRAQTAVPRLLDETKAMHALTGVVLPPPAAQEFYGRLAARPEVDAAGFVPGLAILRVDAAGAIDYSLRSLVPLDGDLHRRFAAPKILAGRLPDPARADEAFVNKQFADRDGLHVGDTLAGYRAFPGYKNPLELTAADGTPVQLRVVGIGADAASLLAEADSPNAAILFVTPAFYRAHPETLNIAFVGVRLRDPTNDMAPFALAAEQLANTFPDRPPGTPFIFGNERDAEARAARAVTPEATALMLFAVFLGFAALVTVGQAFSRQAASWDAKGHVLRAMGYTTGQLASALLGIAIVVGGGAAVVALVIAAASSVVMPLGTAHLAEPHVGFALNVGWLGAGFVAIVAATLVVAMPSIWRRGHAGRASAQRLTSRPGWFDRMRLPTTLGVGLRFGLGRHEAASGGVRRAVPPIALAVVAVAASLTFGSNLEHLVSTPRLYGQTWDVALDAEPAPVPTRAMTSILQDDADVDAFAGGNHGTIAIEGVAVPAMGLDATSDGPYPTVLEGRPATAVDEITLGTRTLDRIHHRVGDDVTVEVSGESRVMRIVGRVVFPRFVLGEIERPELGDGASVLATTLAPPTATADNLYTYFLVDFRDDVDEDAALQRLAALVEPLGPCPYGPCLVQTQRPNDIASAKRVDATPLVLSGFLALLAAATLGHALVTASGRRRRDFAVLKALGFRPNQVAAIVMWQAMSIALIALAIGVLIGSGLALRGWSAFAARIGTDLSASIPGVPLVVAGVASFAVAIAVAFIPAMAVRRSSAAEALRAD
jgi:hypothetical protein